MTISPSSTSAYESDRETRLRFLIVTDKTRAALHEFWTVVEPRLPKILDGFDEHLGSVPALSKLIGNQSSRLKQAQSARSC